MLELIRGKNLCNVLVVVTRYFGGILLGTGGLVRAYAGVTKIALENAVFIEKKQGVELELTVEYSEIENFKYYCRKNEIKITNEEYSNSVKFWIDITKMQLEKIRNEIDNKSLNVTKINKITEKII
jgi:putative IMPACT (imprinted ancient) family translation regulator